MGAFKAYDIRGVYGADFDSETVYRIGRCLPGLLGARRVLIGRDARLSSPAVRDALVRGLVEAGCAVDDLGLCTTPMIYYFTASDGYDASVQITASHNPAPYNGLKISRREAVPVGYDTGLAELERRIGAADLPPPAAPPGACRLINRTAAFLAFLRPWMPDLSGLRLAVDCSDGMASLVVHELFGAGAIVLNDTPDGRFPHHDPNPLEVANCASLMVAVKENRCDAGVIFDGDADRVMFVDEAGAFIQPDLLIPIIARRFLRAEPGARVIHDIRTSRGVIETLRADGAEPVIGKVGHAFAKVLLRACGAVCGGELAGHYYFRDFCCCDSGELAALIVLGELAAARRRGETFSGLIAPIRRYATTGEVNFRVGRKDEAIRAVRAAAESHGPPTTVYDFDGLRLEFAAWWLSVRPSNTEPYLRLIVEAATPDLLAARRAELEAALRPFLLSRAAQV
jgi:phosphomannomutase